MDILKVGGYIIIVVPTLFVGIVIGFYLIQDYMIFLGEKLPANHEYLFREPYEEYDFISTNGHMINVLHFRTEKPVGLVLYHHGNAGNLQSWGNYAADFLKNNWDVVFYDYRGYGKSTGKIRKEHHLHDDARFVLNQIKRKQKYDKIIYYGNSLGSGIAAKLASEEEPSALILETPYYNFWELIHHHYRYLPAKIMSKYKLRTDKYLRDVRCPVLLFHGTHDDVVPYDHSVRLSTLGDNIRLVTIRNGLHNNIPDFKAYHKELKEFLSGVISY